MKLNASRLFPPPPGAHAEMLRITGRSEYMLEDLADGPVGPARLFVTGSELTHQLAYFRANHSMQWQA